jgi:hypothetical protein
MQEVTSQRLITVPLKKDKFFNYLETNLTNQNSTQEEIKSRLKSGNVCYISVQNLLSSCLLSKNIKTVIYRTIFFPFVFYVCV